MDLKENADQIVSAIADEDIVALVARQAGVLVGYGMVSLARHYLGAIYIEPSMMGKKIGSQILAKLETVARNHGLDYLELDASLNSERFYLKNGYKRIGEGVHELQSGVSMACIKMKKHM